MSDYSSYTERDAFNEALCNLVEEYLQDKDAYSEDTVLAVNSKTMEIAPQLVRVGVDNYKWLRRN